MVAWITTITRRMSLLLVAWIVAIILYFHLVTATHNITNDTTTTTTVSQSPKIAWLLSFPNSGTTFTLQSVRKASNRTIAANTCLKWVHTKCIPVYNDHDTTTTTTTTSQQQGPYRISMEELPPVYILTRTHCAGFYPFRRPPRTISNTTLHEFSQACRQTAIVESWGWKSRQSHYDDKVILMDNDNDLRRKQDVVAKAIHLWRNPFDNIVARWRHAKRYIQPILPVSFRWYCRILDQYLWPLGVGKPPREILFRKIPCLSEFARYVQWHNHAVTMSSSSTGSGRMSMDTLHVHYEDYIRSESLKQILDFLELEQLDTGLLFTPNKTYVDQFFSPSEQRTIQSFLQANAKPLVWEQLERYF